MLSTWEVKASTIEQNVTEKITPVVTKKSLKRKEMQIMKKSWVTIEAAIPSTVFFEFGNLTFPYFDPMMLAAESPIPNDRKKQSKSFHELSDNRLKNKIKVIIIFNYVQLIVFYWKLQCFCCRESFLSKHIYYRTEMRL